MFGFICLGIFFSVLFLLLGCFFLWQGNKASNGKFIKNRFRRFNRNSQGITEPVNIVYRSDLSEVSWLNVFLSRIPSVHNMDLLLKQANTKHSLGFYFLLSLLLALSGYWIMIMILENVFFALGVAVLCGLLPMACILIKKQRRMKRFQKQLPEALELIARALRAGHAFSSGMRLVADEFHDPIGSEFLKTVNEINYGISIKEALKNLSSRVDCPDLKYFVTSVTIQQEIGGNLAEILEKIGYIIRERFKLQGRIRVLSAEAKFSAYILMALPVFICIAVYILSPDYLIPLFHEPLGKIMITSACITVVIGYVIMKSMTRIRV